jgi:hypothetical protein
MTRTVSRRSLLLGFSTLAGTLTSKTLRAQSLPCGPQRGLQGRPVLQGRLVV